VKPAHSLARLNGRILNAYSRRTTNALRDALPLRLALPHLEPVLALNVGKEVEKDRLVILRACELMQAGPPDWNEVLPQLLQATKEIDRQFLSRLGAFPVDIVIRYEEIAPVRARRMKLLYDAALKILSARNRDLNLRGALRESFSQEDLAQLLDQLFRLYAEEVRSLSRSVRLPVLLVPLRELIAQELLDVMLRVARPLALEIAATVFRKTAEDSEPAPAPES
jgi:hypothetical protein